MLDSHVRTIISFLFFIIALILYFCVKSLPNAEDKIITAHFYSREVHRKIATFISDNLDCSIYMKQLQLRGVDNNLIMVHALMCMYVNEPHSAAPDSGFSLNFYWQQKYSALVKNYARGYLDQNCSLQYKSGASSKSNKNCYLRSFPVLFNAYASLQMDKIADSLLPDLLLLNLNDIYETKHKDISSNFSRLDDVGGDHTHRVFKPSTLFLNLTEQYKPAMTEWFNTMSLNHSKLTFETKLDINNGNMANLIQKFFLTTNNRNDLYNSRMLQMHEKENIEYFLSIPTNGPTSSIISAFLVTTVYKVMEQETYLEDKETMLYAYFLAAQRITFELLPETIHWSNDSSKKDLFGYIDEVVTRLSNMSLEDLIEIANNADNAILRKKADRVTTIMTWSEANDESFVCVLNIALPKPFDSKYVSGQKNGEFSSFESKKPKQNPSVPFTSSASIIIFTTSAYTATLAPIILSSASGSIRTIEAVAFPVLRYLILNESPGQAVFAPTIFVSLLDGKLKCELDRKNKNNITFQSTNVYRKLKNLHLHCKNVNTQKFEEMDRASYLITRDGKGSSPDKYIKAAVDERFINYNYATGY